MRFVVKKKNGCFGGRHRFLIQYMTAGHVDLFLVVLVVDLIKRRVLPLNSPQEHPHQLRKAEVQGLPPHLPTRDPRCFEDTL